MATQNRKKAENAARELLDEMRITRPPIPVEKIARQLGARLRFSPLDEELSGMVLVKDGAPVIGVNALHHPNRQRFTIAHEIGHLRMHLDQIADEIHVDKQFPVLMRDVVASTGVNKIEIEANSFAAELLMPKHLLIESLKDGAFDLHDDESITILAKKFKVSLQAIQLRLGQISI